MYGFMLFVTVMDKEGRWWRILTLAVTFFISSVSTGMYYTLHLWSGIFAKTDLVMVSGGYHNGSHWGYVCLFKMFTGQGSLKTY